MSGAPDTAGGFWRGFRRGFVQGTTFIFLFPLAVLGALCRATWVGFSIGWTLPEQWQQKEAERALAQMIAANIVLKHQQQQQHKKGYQGPIDLGGGGLN